MSYVGFKARNHPRQTTNPQVDDRATPPDVFARWHDRFGFTVDACATAQNAKLPRFWTLEHDGLAQSWVGERVWCNPPYSSIEPWVAKASRKQYWSGDLVVMLLPANRTEQGWWQRWIEPTRDRGGLLRVEFLQGRMRFIAHNDTQIRPNARPPFGVCLAIWDQSATVPEMAPNPF
jgi:phage N-6-adenine-methyltransferase